VHALADDVVLIDENMIRVDQQLELWTTEYMRCQFSDDNSDDEDVVWTDK
jgi:hypothetical protein